MLKIMDDDEKGKRFLKLIDDQNNIQWNLVAKLSALINSKWNSVNYKMILKTLVKKHSNYQRDKQFR